MSQPISIRKELGHALFMISGIDPIFRFRTPGSTACKRKSKYESIGLYGKTSHKMSEINWASHDFKSYLMPFVGKFIRI